MYVGYPGRKPIRDPTGFSRNVKDPGTCKITQDPT